MIILFLASIGLILYGTMFPFTFVAGAHTGGVVDVLLNSIFVLPGRGDVLSNLVLFLPFGFFGMQSLPQRWPTFLKYAMVFLPGVALSLGIECAQFYNPARTTSLYDLGLNSISALVGAAGGRFNWQGVAAAGLGTARPRSIYPLFLLVGWLGYRLFPYVPTIDFQHVKDAIKPLMALGNVDLVDIFRYTVTGLVLARLSQAILPAKLATLGFLVFVFGAIAAKPFIMTKVISPSELIGTVIAAVLWLAMFARIRFSTGIIATLLAAAIAVQGLIPFELSAEMGHFSYVPFGGFTTGSMATNLQAFLEKVFLYGSLVWLVAQAGGSTPFSLLFSIVYLTGVELAQVFVAGRTSEITDPLMALILGIALLALERHYRKMDAANIAPA